MPNVHLAKAVSAENNRFREEIELAAEYLRLTDPTPLTRELIEKELGPFVESDECSYWWFIGRRELGFCVIGPQLDADGLLVDKPTLGHLRWLVAMLRGGV